MFKKNNYFDPVSETGNWNVAADFVKYKIMKLLYECDQYQMISIFGTSEMIAEFITNNEMKTIARLNSIKRLFENLKLIIENTHFAIRKADKIKFDEYYKTLERIENLMPMIEQIKIVDGRKKIDINEDAFKGLLKEMIKIKKDINEPLNNADLIFNKFEEFDPDKFKESVMKRMSDRP